MDNHPIPQDVTGFQFRLIGDMTVKQFGFVAAGCVIGFVLFYFPVTPFIKIPLGALFALTGVALAFLPVEGRPADVMLSNFIKALFTPNQYAYHKNGGHLSFLQVNTKSISEITQHAASKTSAKTSGAAEKQQRLATYLQSIHQDTLTSLDQKESGYLNQVASYQPQMTSIPQQSQPVVTQNISANIPQKKLDEDRIPEQQTPTPTPTPQLSTPPNPSPQSAAQEDRTAQKAIEDALVQAKNEEITEKDSQKLEAAHHKVKTLEEQLKTLLDKQSALEQELALLKAEKELGQTAQKTTPTTQPPSPTAATIQTAAPASNPSYPTQPPAPEASSAQKIEQPPAPQAQPQIQQSAQQPTQSIRQLTPEEAKQMGLPRLPDIPNLIIGIVKDPRGNALPNILVEVKDKSGTPARAFRTNALGQFASATPLASDTYTLTFEDPKSLHRFDNLEIVAKGEILLPLEIKSYDAREDLRRELFS